MERWASDKRLYIHALTLCVNFYDYLVWTLPQNIRHFDSFSVVTTDRDVETQQIASLHLRIIGGKPRLAR